MKAEKLFTIITVLLVFGVTESFGAASIRTTTVGASGPATTASRAGSLRTESAKTSSTNKLSSNVSATSNTGSDGGRMASLPGGMPKVSKPNLPSAAYTANVDLSDIEARLDELQTNKADLDALNGLATLDDLGAKADASDVYTKSQVDGMIPDVSDLATKSELDAKANASSVYTKTEVDGKIANLEVGVDENAVGALIDTRLTSYSTTAQMNAAISSATSGLVTQTQLDAKANSADVYTKTQVDSKVDAKMDNPSGGTSGQVLARNATGGVEWIDPATSPNVQLTTFDGEDGKLFYCGKTNGAECSTTDKNDGWIATDLIGLKGKDACQRFTYQLNASLSNSESLVYDILCNED